MEDGCQSRTYFYHLGIDVDYELDSRRIGKPSWESEIETHSGILKVSDLAGYVLEPGDLDLWLARRYDVQASGEEEHAGEHDR